MNRIALFLLAVFALLIPDLASAQNMNALTVTSCGAQGYDVGQGRPVTQDTTGLLCDKGGSGGGSTTANQGTPNAGGATNSWPVQGAGVAGTPAGGVVSIQGVAGGTAQPISAASLPLPTGAATSANQSAGTSASPSAVVETVQGNVASGAADAGNPVKTGGVFNTTLPTVTTGQRVDAQYDANGKAISVTSGLANSLADGRTNTPIISLYANASGAESGISATPGYGYSYNGSTWDRSFTCANQAAINVTAGSTTQIVALSGTTVIRVCNFTVSMSAAGTASVLTGTGTNCGTPTTIIQPMSLATGTPLNIMGPAGGAAFRSTAGGEICVAAVTGNVTGYLSYAQY